MLFVLSSFPAQSYPAMSQELAADAAVRTPPSGPSLPDKHHALNALFTSLDFLRGKYRCNLCQWVTNSNSVRRRLEHVVGEGTSVKACSMVSTAAANLVACVREDLRELNAKALAGKKKKASSVSACKSLFSPKRQRTIPACLPKQTKDCLDMDYAKMVIMCACKTTFMESPFSLDFFSKHFGYTPPSRATVMGPLLEELYLDTQRKVKKQLKLFDPDALVTISMDGWEAPTHEHIRNYMLVGDKITFFHTAINCGTVAQTGVQIGRDCIKVGCFCAFLCRFYS